MGGQADLTIVWQTLQCPDGNKSGEHRAIQNINARPRREQREATTKHVSLPTLGRRSAVNGTSGCLRLAQSGRGRTSRHCGQERCETRHEATSFLAVVSSKHRTHRGAAEVAATAVALAWEWPCWSFHSAFLPFLIAAGSRHRAGYPIRSSSSSALILQLLKGLLAIDRNRGCCRAYAQHLACL